MIKVVNHTMLALDFHANCICVACEECGHRGVVHKLMLQGHRRNTKGECTRRPHAGAWIETTPTACAWPAKSVAPHAGA